MIFKFMGEKMSNIKVEVTVPETNSVQEITGHITDYSQLGNELKLTIEVSAWGERAPLTKGDWDFLVDYMKDRHERK